LNHLSYNTNRIIYEKIIYFGEEVEGYNIPFERKRNKGGGGDIFFFTFLVLMQIIFNQNFVMIKYVITGFLADILVRVFIKPKFSPSLIIGRLIVRNQVPEYVWAKQKKFS